MINPDLINSVVAGILLVSGANAMACGESLFRVGNGARLPDGLTAPLPGKILIVTRVEGGQILADALLDAGHDVHVVESAADVSAELSEGGFDIVLALFSERQAIEAQMAAFEASYIPLAVGEERELARETYSRVLSVDDNLKRFLRTIHRTLKLASA